MALTGIKLAGSPYEQGFQHGQALRTSIAKNISLYFDRFRREVFLAAEVVTQRALQYAEAIQHHNPAYFQTMQGIADGSGHSFADIAALNVRYEILYYEFGAGEEAKQQGADGCTAFALASNKTAEKQLYLGENWDWIPGVEGAVVHSQWQDLSLLAYTEAGIVGEKIGLNSAGLGLVINGLTSLSDDWQSLRKPFHVRCYEILRSSTIEQACEVVTGEVRACSSNFLIAQVPDQIISIEAAPQRFHHLHCQNGVLTHANHFSNPQALGIHEGLDDFHEASCHRQARLQRLLDDQSKLTVADIQGIMRDHDGHPNSVCRHEDSSYGDEEHYHSVVSVIMNLHQRRLWISDGPPCQHAYHSYHL